MCSETENYSLWQHSMDPTVNGLCTWVITYLEFIIQLGK